MDERKKLFREVQDYAHSSGLVIKKVPIDVLKALDKWTKAGHGDPSKSTHAAAAKLRRLGWDESIVASLHTATNDENLKKYISEVMQGDPWSKHANVFAFFRAGRDTTIKPMRLVGLAATGTFNPNRYDEDGDFSYQSQGMHFDNSVAEVELVVAHNLGKAVTLWVLGELLSKKAQGAPRYNRVVSIVNPVNMQRILNSLQFEFRQCREVHQNGEVTNMTETGGSDKLFVLNPNVHNVQSIRDLLRVERPGLYDICPPGGPALGGTRGWQLCR